MINQQIAEMILEQLGGARFRVMTGAKDFLSHPEGALSFKLPGAGGFCKDGINYVKIYLNAADTYDLTFGRVRGRDYRLVAQRADIYADQLRDVFTRETGLAVSLGTMR